MLDITVADASVYEVPMKLGLKVMTIVGSDLVSSKPEGFDDVLKKAVGVA